MTAVQLPMLLLMLIVFAAVVLAVLALAPLFTPAVGMTRRLTAMRPPVTISRSGPTLRADDAGSLWHRLVVAIEQRGLSLTDTKSDVLVDKLMLAGFTQSFAPRVFVLLRTVCTLAVPVIGLGLVTLMYGWPSTRSLYLIFVGLAVVGLYLPNLIVSSRTAERRKEILNGFPDTLDLLLVCVEAGLGIDQAFSRVGAEIVGSHPLLAELLANVALELRAGRARDVALRNLTRRSGVAEIAAFVTLLIQSNKLGSSIAQALKIYAGEMREARKMRAEEKAHRIPVLLSLPIVCFLLPIILAVFMLPVAINMRDSMGGVLGAGASDKTMTSAAIAP